MQVSTLDRRIFLRADHRLIAAARAKADRDGVTLSELVRNAVHSEVREAA